MNLQNRKGIELMSKTLTPSKRQDKQGYLIKVGNAKYSHHCVAGQSLPISSSSKSRKKSSSRVSVNYKSN